MKREPIVVVLAVLAIWGAACGDGGGRGLDGGHGLPDGMPNVATTVDQGADMPRPMDTASDVPLAKDSILAETGADLPTLAIDTPRDLANLDDGARTPLIDAATDAPPNPLPWVRRGTVGVAGTDRPGARRGHAMAYDESRGKVVLFGGHASDFYCANGVCDDTWEWDGAAGTWSKLAPVGGTKPPPREQHAMTYDPIRKRVLLVGGSDGVVLRDGGFHSTFRQDTWEWDGSTWTDVTPAGASPSPRGSAGLVWDRGRGRAVLFGGGEYDGANPRSDTWEWDGATASWTPRTPLRNPPARQAHAMAYHPGQGSVFLFGGSTGSALLDDAWEWHGDAGDWTALSPADPRPPRRVFPCLAYHAGRGALMMVGGAGSALATTSETWEWDPFGWTNWGTAVDMPGRAYHAMVYDAGRGKLVVFGGVTNGGSQILDDLWEL